VKKGETVGIIGRNGSGKSTLLQLICGTLNPTYGNIEVNGRIAALLELGSGFNPEFTGRENVYMNAALIGLSRDEIDNRFDDIVSFADIGNFIGQPVKTYSSGMVVRLAFAIAINADPEILIVDEALSVGDELFQRKCFSRIEMIRMRGSTILFVSHSASTIVDLCDRAILVDAGQTISTGPPINIVGLYQKLLYAPIVKKAGIRSEIIRQSEGHFFAGDDLTANGGGAIVSEHSAALSQETYDPNLIPASTIEYESYGPVIGMPSILTQDGVKVNGLVRGRQYRYCYSVFFGSTASSIRFGMSIKSTVGLLIAGSLSASNLEHAIPSVNKGSSVDVEFLFDCHLNPGVYFMNAGVFGIMNGEEMLLHRRAEIIAFRVLPVYENIETEMVSLLFKPKVKINA
jgi:lipopolysaccharide transport system ATP-binding protein